MIQKPIIKKLLLEMADILTFLGTDIEISNNLDEELFLEKFNDARRAISSLSRFVYGE